jgi:hypothetical protein
MNSKTLPFKKRENPLVQNEPVISQTKPTENTSREKYTATMEKSLRKKVKLAAVEKGIMFSQYIEDAVIEKLEREGY